MLPFEFVVTLSLTIFKLCRTFVVCSIVVCTCSIAYIANKYESKKDGKDQETIQSSTTTDLGYHMV